MIELLSNTAHIHLLLNHVPTTAFFVGLVLYVIALVNGNDTMKKAGLGIFFMVAVVISALSVIAALFVKQGRLRSSNRDDAVADEPRIDASPAA